MLRRANSVRMRPIWNFHVSIVIVPGANTRWQPPHRVRSTTAPGSFSSGSVDEHAVATNATSSRTALRAIPGSTPSAPAPRRPRPRAPPGRGPTPPAHGAGPGGDLLRGAVTDGQQADVRLREAELLADFRGDLDVRRRHADAQAVALLGHQHAVVELGAELQRETLHEPEVEHVAVVAELRLDADRHLIVVPVQRLAESGVGDDVRRRELEVVLGHDDAVALRHGHAALIARASPGAEGTGCGAPRNGSNLRAGPPRHPASGGIPVMLVYAPSVAGVRRIHERSPAGSNAPRMRSPGNDRHVTRKKDQP